MNEMVHIHPELESLRSMFADINPVELFAIKDEDGDQNLTGTVIGYKLDNAHGNHVSARAVINGYQEFVIALESFRKDRPFALGFHRNEFNLATLIAIVREHYPAIRQTLRDQGERMALLNGIMSITEGARADMHEPDEQNIFAEVVSASREISYRYFEERDVEFALFRTIDGGPLVIKGPNAARVEVRFTVQDLIVLLLAIKD